MTTVVVALDPPRTGLVLSKLSDATPLGRSEAARLYAAMAGDVLNAAESAGGELLVNYRTEETIPKKSDSGERNDEGTDDERTETDAETAVRQLAGTALDTPENARYEPQVGSTHAARLGNTVTHLLEREEESSVIVVSPRAPFVRRSTIDGLAVKSRTSEVVLGPASRGRTYGSCFTDPIDFTEIDRPPTVRTLAERAVDEGYEVDFAPRNPVIESGGDLSGAIASIDARRRAGRVYPERTAACLDDLGTEVVADGDGLAIRRE